MFLVADGSGCTAAVALVAHLDDGNPGSRNDLQG